MPVAETPIVEKRNSQTVSLGHLDVNISAISRATGIDVSHLSRVFSGHRIPTVDNVQKIASCLDLPLEDVVKFLEQKRESPRPIKRRNTSD